MKKKRQGGATSLCVTRRAGEDMRIQWHHTAFFPFRWRLMIALYGSESRPPLICQSQPKSIHLQHVADSFTRWELNGDFVITFVMYDFCLINHNYFFFHICQRQWLINVAKFPVQCVAFSMILARSPRGGGPSFSLILYNISTCTEYIGTKTANFWWFLNFVLSVRIHRCIAVKL